MTEWDRHAQKVWEWQIETLRDEQQRKMALKKEPFDFMKYSNNTIYHKKLYITNITIKHNSSHYLPLWYKYHNKIQFISLFTSMIQIL